jgi:hypothetical protein
MIYMKSSRAQCVTWSISDHVLALMMNQWIDNVLATRDRVEFLSNVRRRCEALWKQVWDRAERNYNKKKIQIEFKINDKIFLNAKNIIFIKSFKKLNYKYYESYMISASVNKISYRFDFFFIMKNIYDVFHVFFLELVKNKNDETSSLI